jgi:hypothetical protein
VVAGHHWPLGSALLQGVNLLTPENEERLADMVAEGELRAERLNDVLEMEAAASKGTGKR